MKDEHIHDEHLSETKPTKRETFRAYLWALIDRPVTIWRGKFYLLHYRSSTVVVKIPKTDSI